MGTPEIQLVIAWAECINTLDADAIERLADPDIEIVLMRGAVRGREELRRFIERQRYGVGMTVHPHSFFQRAGTVVAAARVEMRFVDSGELAEVADRAVGFEIADCLVQRFVVFSELAAALEATGLTRDDRAELDSRA